MAAGSCIRASFPTDDPGLQAKQQSSWSDYQQSLSRHGWRPESVPARRRAAVVSNVRKKVPVPANWHPADQFSFRLAVKQRYASEAASKGVTVKGDRIPPGLSFPAFVARPGIQAVLREGPDGGSGGEESRGLCLPKGAVVQEPTAVRASSAACSTSLRPPDAGKAGGIPRQPGRLRGWRQVL